MSSRDTRQAVQQLRLLLEAFVKGEDRSLNMARRIEGHIASTFPSDHAIQELAEAFAQYGPGGGDFLYSEAELLPQVARWLKRAEDNHL